MSIFHNFIQIELIPEMQKIAVRHAKLRTEAIIRQFIPRHAPLSHIESNYIGALGEIVVRDYFGFPINLKDDYAANHVDSGDICIDGKMYDIKTEATPVRYYRKLFYGTIKPHEPYGCRVWTAKHEHHLEKYDGGVIFVAIPIPNDSKSDRKEGLLRPRIIDFARQIIIIGYVERSRFNSMKPDWYSPPHPVTGKRRKYNSPNYIFHHSVIHPLWGLKNINSSHGSTGSP